MCLIYVSCGNIKKKKVFCINEDIIKGSISVAHNIPPYEIILPESKVFDSIYSMIPLTDDTIYSWYIIKSSGQKINYHHIMSNDGYDCFYGQILDY